MSIPITQIGLHAYHRNRFLQTDTSPQKKKKKKEGLHAEIPIIQKRILLKEITIHTYL